jgi:type IX secretion system PorP/SprF family membrane protein
MNKRQYIAILSICFVALTAKAQDPIFAQYYAAPLSLNPAMMGVFQGQWRMNTNYRQQWNRTFETLQPFRTIHAGFDYRVRVLDADYFAFGLNAMEDRSGALSNFKSTKGHLGLSYMKQLSGDRYRTADQYLVAGMQVGLGQFALATDGLWFDRQYDSTSASVNFTSASGEVAPQSNMYIDFNAGIMWYMVADDNRSLYVGGSVHHLSQPNVSFFGNSKEVLRRRFSLNIGGEFPLNEELSVLPSAMATLQGPSMTTLFGANMRYSNHDWQEVAIRIGGSYRIANRYKWTQNGTVGGSGILGDALTVTGMLEFNSWLLGGSYDIHTSSIARPTNGRGAWEISLIYIAPERFSVKTSCPKF